MENMCNINAKTELNKTTAITFACQYGKHDVLELFLNTLSCDIEQRSNVMIYFFL